MIILYEPHKEFLKKLLSHDVEFILIGGYAVNFHGYNRPTGDMDIWLKPSNPNKEKFLKFMKLEDFSPESIKQVAQLDFTKDTAFFFGEMPLRIDFLTRISGVEFDEAWKQKNTLSITGIDIPVLHLHHLILSKISNPRTKDKLDVEELQKVEKLKKRKK